MFEWLKKSNERKGMERLIRSVKAVAPVNAKYYGELAILPIDNALRLRAKAGLERMGTITIDRYFTFSEHNFDLLFGLHLCLFNSSFVKWFSVLEENPMKIAYIGKYYIVEWTLPKSGVTN